MLAFNVLHLVMDLDGMLELAMRALRPGGRQGMDIVSVERHGTRSEDIRFFIVARKPA